MNIINILEYSNAELDAAIMVRYAKSKHKIDLELEPITMLVNDGLRYTKKLVDDMAKAKGDGWDDSPYEWLKVKIGFRSEAQKNRIDQFLVDRIKRNAEKLRDDIVVVSERPDLVGQIDHDSLQGLKEAMGNVPMEVAQD